MWKLKDKSFNYFFYSNADNMEIIKYVDFTKNKFYYLKKYNIIFSIVQWINNMKH